MATNDIDSELEMTRQFVDFYDSWQGNPWHGRLQKEYDERMKDNRLILRPVKFSKDVADKLYSNAKVNRVFSVLFGLLFAALMKLIGDFGLTKALATGWISIGNLWMMGGLLLASRRVSQ